MVTRLKLFPQPSVRSSKSKLITPGLYRYDCRAMICTAASYSQRPSQHAYCSSQIPLILFYCLHAEYAKCASRCVARPCNKLWR